MNKNKISLHDPSDDLIDLIWPNTERPPKPNSQIKIHNISGQTWQKKVQEVRLDLKKNEADLVVVTALDEVAWLFNLRAADIPYNPMFFAYAIVSKTNVQLFIDQNRLKDDELQNHLDGVDFKDYNQIEEMIKNYSDNGQKIWISPMSSYSIYNAVLNKTLLVYKSSPVRSLKARKNPVEIKNLKYCHIRDSAARVRHMYWLETQMKLGKTLSEKQASRKLEEIQK